VSLAIGCRRVALGVVFAAAFPALSLAEPAATTPVPASTAAADKKISDLLTGLKLTLPDDLDTNELVRPSLVELSREPCDKAAIVKFAEALKTAGYKREAAMSLTGFSDACNGDVKSLRSAANIYLGISDYHAVIDVATQLIKLEPFADNGYYLRALGYDKADIPQKAIDDYTTAIELFGNKERISSVSYVAIALNYEKLGQYCNAAAAIEMWIGNDPARNDNSQSQSIAGKYRTKSQCAMTVGSEDTFPVSRNGNVAIVPVTINGVKGRFILDTGASFVALNGEFAERAKIDVDNQTRILMHTANGAVLAKRGRASMVELRSLQSKDVAVVVPEDAKTAFMSGVDGLLGMSFLSRFDIKIEGQKIRVRGRSKVAEKTAAPVETSSTKPKPAIAAKSKSKPKPQTSDYGLR
jgi:clan AA aspartic protease (TIGR02281 family)